jgi:hypothetical protein
LQVHKEYKVVVKAGASSLEGPLRSDKDMECTFSTIPPFQVATTETNTKSHYKYQACGTWEMYDMQLDL